MPTGRTLLRCEGPPARQSEPHGVQGGIASGPLGDDDVAARVGRHRRSLHHPALMSSNERQLGLVRRQPSAETAGNVANEADPVQTYSPR